VTLPYSTGTLAALLTLLVEYDGNDNEICGIHSKPPQTSSYYQALRRTLYKELLSAESTTTKLRRPCPPHHPRARSTRLWLSSGIFHQPAARRYYLPLSPDSPSFLLMPFTDLIAALGEATATPYFIYRLRSVMLSSPTGRRILRDRPRITSQTLSMPHLRTLPTNSVGRAYAAWLDREGVSPDTRDQVKYIDDEECAYVMQRYRECHDFYHALTGLPVMVEGEVALKAFEFANTLLPMTGLSLVAVTRLKSAERKRFWKTYLPWAVRNGLRAEEIVNVYWEEQLERDVDELRMELGIERPPDLRETRKTERDERRKAKEARERIGGLMGN